jgi:hypothetical protein
VLSVIEDVLAGHDHVLDALRALHRRGEPLGPSRVISPP